MQQIKWRSEAIKGFFDVDFKFGKGDNSTTPARDEVVIAYYARS